MTTPRPDDRYVRRLLFRLEDMTAYTDQVSNSNQSVLYYSIPNQRIEMNICNTSQLVLLT